MKSFYIKGKFDGFLQKWKEGAFRLPLILNGDRQVGKTEAIRNFARQSYASVAVIARISRRNPSFRFEDCCVLGGMPQVVSRKWGVKYACANVGFESNILTLPHSTVFLLRRMLQTSRSLGK